jgi:hypothetical protein
VDLQAKNSAGIVIHLLRMTAYWLMRHIFLDAYAQLLGVGIQNSVHHTAIVATMILHRNTHDNLVDIQSRVLMLWILRAPVLSIVRLSRHDK